MDNWTDNKLRFEGAVDLAAILGIYDADKRELWCLRIKNCPDPDHGDGRTWCAYCGNLK